MTDLLKALFLRMKPRDAGFALFFWIWGGLSGMAFQARYWRQLKGTCSAWGKDRDWYFGALASAIAVCALVFSAWMNKRHEEQKEDT